MKGRFIDIQHEYIFCVTGEIWVVSISEGNNEYMIYKEGRLRQHTKKQPIPEHLTTDASFTVFQPTQVKKLLIDYLESIKPGCKYPLCTNHMKKAKGYCCSACACDHTSYLGKD